MEISNMQALLNKTHDSIDVSAKVLKRLAENQKRFKESFHSYHKMLTSLRDEWNQYQ